MNKKIGFIGCGKMASAIIKGILASDNKNNLEIKGSEINCEIAEAAQERLGITVLSDNKALAIDSDIIFIATKPNYAAQVLEEIKDELTEDKLIVSIAAGISTQTISNIIGTHRIIRVMPNTPALVKEGMSGVCKGEFAREEDIEFVKTLLSGIGKCIEVTEAQSRLIKRCIYAVAIFFITSLVTLIMSLVGTGANGGDGEANTTSWADCWNSI